MRPPKVALLCGFFALYLPGDAEALSTRLAVEHSLVQRQRQQQTYQDISFSLQSRCKERNVGIFSYKAASRVSTKSNDSEETEQSNGGNKTCTSRRKHFTHAVSRNFLCALVGGWIGLASWCSSAVAISSGKQYWSIMDESDSDNRQERISANEGLMDYAVGTINAVYYDNSGGAYFTQQDFYNRWRHLRDDVRKREQLEQPQKAHIASSSPSHVKMSDKSHEDHNSDGTVPSDITFATREGVVNGLKWLVSSLNDPYSMYLTRDELRQELSKSSNSKDFLGLGALVEPPQSKAASSRFFAETTPTFATVIPESDSSTKSKVPPGGAVPASMLNANDITNLPLVTAVTPYSKAERTGIVVGDRIVAIGDVNFVEMKSREKVAKSFSSILEDFNSMKDDDTRKYNPDTIIVAKPVIRSLTTPGELSAASAMFSSTTTDEQQVAFPYLLRPPNREVVIGYRPTKVRLQQQRAVWDTESSMPADVEQQQQERPVSTETAAVPLRTSGGDEIVHYELLTPSNSIFGKSYVNGMLSPSSSLLLSRQGGNSPMVGNYNNNEEDIKVGYIRLTRFSKASTAGYLAAVDQLERAGANAYVIDLRNNYGGIIQEAMLTASSLIRDPHAIMCFTLTSRGGFTPHDVTEYIVDPRYPGYLLSKESKFAALHQVKREQPEMFASDGTNGWDPPSSFASISEQRKKRGIHLSTYYAKFTKNHDHESNHNNDSNLQRNAMFSSTSGTAAGLGTDASSSSTNTWSHDHMASANMYLQQLRAQKRIILLTNEGTASSAEVFAAALHDNGRTTAVIGTRTYGKGLIQHTIPMPDGGGLRLTVAEYLTPSLRHVTNMPQAKFWDRSTGEWVSTGGIKPDIMCTESRQGIPSNIGADYCVGMAMDILQELE